MIEAIQHIDEWLLHQIRDVGSCNLFDTLMPLFRNPFFWIPVYAYLLVFMYKTYGTKGLWWCAFFLLTFACCDFISAGILKPFFHRIRPCNMIGITDISALVPCGHGFSFPSSHASNHFGLSFFIIFTLSKKYKHVVWLALLWALLVVYAQMYVGVHYPSDIIAGMFLGLVIGWLVSSLFRWIKRDLII